MHMCFFLGEMCLKAVLNIKRQIMKVKESQDKSLMMRKLCANTPSKPIVLVKEDPITIIHWSSFSGIDCSCI